MIELDFLGIGGKRAFETLTSQEFTEWPPYIKKIERNGANNLPTDWFVGGILFDDNDSDIIKNEILKIESSWNLKVDYDVVKGYFPAHLERHHNLDNYRN